MSFDLSRIQQELQSQGIDGWLLYDFRGSNPLARRILKFSEGSLSSRRYVYGIPATGEPMKLVHRIETDALDHLPGSKTVYLHWQEFEAGLQSFCEGKKRVAMEFAPLGGNPYVSRVDAGTVDLVRSFGVEVVSSGNLIQVFEAVLNEEQFQSHLFASKVTHAAFDVAWKLIAEGARSGSGIEEKAVADAIEQHFEAHGCEATHAPIVARNEHSGLPHYETGSGKETLIREGDFVLIDLWARQKSPRSVFSDQTRVGFVGTEVPEKYSNVFRVVATSRDAGIQTVKEAFAAGRKILGGEVDDAVRKVIADAGYGAFFTHRTGHNIGVDLHGNGAHIDNLETREDRYLIAGTCFSIEPGIYLDEFGIRSEIDVFIDSNSTVHVTGGLLQQDVIPILKQY